jgi:hypothetical protein
VGVRPETGVAVCAAAGQSRATQQTNFSEDSRDGDRFGRAVVGRVKDDLLKAGVPEVYLLAGLGQPDGSASGFRMCAAP